jgi:hypothetical protein
MKELMERYWSSVDEGEFQASDSCCPELWLIVSRNC